MNNSKISDMTNVMLKVPPPGVSLKDYERAQKTNLVPDNEISTMSERVVSRKGEETRYQDNECSICLGNFSEGETVSWSALDCEHIFHQDCLLNWLMTLGQKSIGDRNGNTIMQVHLCRYSMKCPNCRQDFIPKAKWLMISFILENSILSFNNTIFKWIYFQNLYLLLVQYSFFFSI